MRILRGVGEQQRSGDGARKPDEPTDFSTPIPLRDSSGSALRAAERAAVEPSGHRYGPDDEHPHYLQVNARRVNGAAYVLGQLEHLVEHPEAYRREEHLAQAVEDLRVCVLAPDAQLDALLARRRTAAAEAYRRAAQLQASVDDEAVS